MADTFDKATRSRIMRAIKSRDTKPEVRLRAALRGLGVTVDSGEGLRGRPDVLVPEARLAVFVHGCFWHRCPRHYRAPRTRAAHWRRHIAGNVRRDARVRRALRRAGYRTMVVWEHEPAATAAARVMRRAAR